MRRDAVVRRTKRRWIRGLALTGLLSAYAGCDTGADDTQAIASNLSADGVGVEAAEMQRINDFLDSQYKRGDVRHAFRSAEGEDIDCVDFMAQPAFKNSAVRPHPPHARPARRSAQARAPRPRAFSTLTDGSLDENGNVRRCPAGSVPILRLSATTIARAGGLSAFVSASRKVRLPPRPGEAVPPATSTPSYKYATGVNNNFPSGSFGFDWISALYNPAITPGDHSISQTWLASPGITAGAGCSGDNCVQTLEAGWNVDQAVNGDTKTHLFIFSTRDGYTATGCYNLLPSCGPGTSGSGFVMDPNAPFTPGQILPNSKAGDANPLELELTWEFGFDPDSGDGNWYLYENFSDLIGYIPSNPFTVQGGGGAPLITSFAIGQAGGEVYDSAPGGHDTTADMGSGQFAAKGFKQAAYQSQIYYENSSATWVVSPKLGTPSMTKASEYTASFTPAAGGTGWGTYFYFGGPGLTAPSAPTGVSATASNGRVTVKWSAAALADSYTVKRATTSGGPYTSIKTGVTTTSYTDGTVTRGRKYYYVVVAVNSVGTSPNSSQVSVTP
jgi:hypothetical protein